MKLLLNADDLGYTPAINQAIFTLHQQERLFSVSMLVNQPYSSDALIRLRAYPELGVGVHLNLSKGRPVLASAQIPTLVDTTGEFWSTKLFFVKATARRINLREVEAELQAQIEKALDFGIRPTHLDSHAHWHILPHLRRLVIRLAEDFQIPGMRQATPRRTLLPSRFWLTMATRKAPPQSASLIPDYMLSLHHWMGSNGQPTKLFFGNALRRLLKRPGISLELVTHPGARHDPDFPSDTLLTHQRQWEFDFLLSSGFDEWLEMMEVRIINYTAL